jgi:hypothetical protein
MGEMKGGVVAALLVAATGTAAEAGPVRLVVADLPYERVWEAAVRAVEEYPIERAAEGLIVTGWRERPPRAGEAEFERVAERLRLRVERFAERITRVSVEADARGWRDGAWTEIADADALAREVVARFRVPEG